MANASVKISVDPTKVVQATAVGDSITAGFGPSPPTGIGGYRYPLYLANPGLTFSGTMFAVGYHEGYSGFTIEQISAVVLPLLDTVLVPTAILLTAGTNNINGSGETAAATKAKLDTFIAALLAKTCVTKVLVGTIPPIAAFLAVSAAYNALILATAPAGGATYHDTTSTLVIPTDFADGLHPNTLGYAKMAALWGVAVQAQLF